VENGTEMAKNERGAKHSLRPFYKECGRGRKFGPNGIETGVHKLFFGALQPKLRASAISSGSVAVIIFFLKDKSLVAPGGLFS